MEVTLPPKTGLTGTGLKWIAMVSMLVDHIAVMGMTSFLAAYTGPIEPTTFVFYYFCRAVGRVAFPIFCFLLAEGFLHTHNRAGYLRNLVIFSVISEPAFDLAVNGVVFELQKQNVFFTLAIGLSAIWLIDRFEGKEFLQFTAGLVCAAISELVSADYAACGVVLIIIFYIFRNSRKRMFFIGGIWLFFCTFLQRILNTLLAWENAEVSAPILLSALFLGSLELCGAFSFLFIRKYNGHRGKSLPKYFFYAFYPGHLLILAGIF